MRHMLILGLAALAVGGPAAAQSPKAVVELFTSQGCSSCPPADAKLAELAGRPDLVALTFPVDYWDYLGWKDTLAQPAFSARQRAYAEARGDRGVYTPQMVVSGAVACVGSNEAQVERSIARAVAGRATLPVALDLRETGSTVTVGVAAGAPAPAEVWLLPVAKLRRIAIARGENRGREILYANVVQGMTRLGSWSGEAQRFEAPLSAARAPDADGYVVLLQASPDGKPGRILGAAKSAGL